MALKLVVNLLQILYVLYFEEFGLFCVSMLSHILITEYEFCFLISGVFIWNIEEKKA